MIIHWFNFVVGRISIFLSFIEKIPPLLPCLTDSICTHMLKWPDKSSTTPAQHHMSLLIHHNTHIRMTACLISLCHCAHQITIIVWSCQFSIFFFPFENLQSRTHSHFPPATSLSECLRHIHCENNSSKLNQNKKKNTNLTRDGYVIAHCHIIALLCVACLCS